MIFNINFKILSTLTKRAFVGCELYRYQNARYNDKKWNNKLCSSCNIIRVKKYRTMRYHVASKHDEKLPHGGAMKR